jgi:hypothetical protein
VRTHILAAAAAAFLTACGAAERGNDAPAEAPAASGGNGAAEAPKPPRRDDVVATDALPLRFHGTYDESGEACRRPSMYRLTVSARELRFHESIGTIREVVPESPDSVGVAADFEGEGERWRSMRQLRLSDAGARLTVSGDGTAMTRVRCTDEHPVARPRLTRMPARP